MRKIAIAVVILSALLAVCSLQARCEEPAKPEATRMAPVDLARLDAARAKEQLFYLQAQAAMAEQRAIISAICGEYKIDCARLDRVVDMKTGDIRREPKAAPAPAKTKGGKS